jgi:acetyl esterase/lipase
MTMTTADSVAGRHLQSPRSTRWALAITSLALFYLAGGDGAAPEASPVFADLTGLPPLLIQVGSSELLLDDAVRLAGRAGADEVEATLEVAPRQPHVFQLDAESAEVAAALDRAGRFLATRLRGEKEEA